MQRGDGKEAKRSSLPKGWTADRSISRRRWRCCRCRARSACIPETGKPITAGLGRYGPFVLHDGTYANLDSVEEVFSIGLNRAVTLIAEKQPKGGGGRKAATPAALKALGEHPEAAASHSPRRPLRALRQPRQGQRDACRRARTRCR